MVTEQAKYSVGDPVSTVRMLNRNGAIVDYSSQSLAGRRLALIFVAGDESPEDWARVADNLANLRAVDTLCAVVARSATGIPALADGVELLIDPKSEAGAAFGIASPASVLLGADSRVLDIALGRDFGRLVSVAEANHLSSRPITVQRHAPVIIIDHVLDEAVCANLMEYWRQGAKRVDSVASAKRGNEAQIATVKRREDVIVEDRALVALLRKHMARRVLGEIRKVHHMEIVGHEAFRIGCYESANEGFFGRHRDNATPHTAHRRYALTLNLNDDYEGGELVFPEYGRMLYRPAKGGAIVFSCALLHEALPVKAGRRFVLLSFFFDQAGARQEKEMLGRVSQKGPT